MSTKSVAIGCFACCISFIVGYFIKGSTTKETNLQTAESQSQITEQKSTRLKSDFVNTSVIVTDNSNTADVQSKPDALKDFLMQHQNSNYFTITNKSLAPLYLQLSQLAPHLLQQKAQELFSLLPNTAASKALGITLEVLAEQEPIAALEMAINSSISEEYKWTYAWSVLSVWTTNSPLDAYEWYLVQDFSQSNLKGFGTENMVSTAVLSGLYSYDKTLAIAKITELSQQSKLNPSSLSLTSRDINRSEEFRDLLNALSSDKHRKMGLTEIAGEWFSKAPDDAAAWLNMLSEEQKSESLLRHALNRWGESNPLQASNWYIKQFDEQYQSKAISEAATSFASYDPKAALDWVDSLDRNDTEFAVEELLHRASYEDPDFVIAHLDRVNEKERKISVLQSAIYSIYQQDPAKAKRIIDTSPYKHDLEEYLNRINEYL